MVRQRLSPNPVPWPAPFVVKKGSMICDLIFNGMTGPLLITEKTMNSPARLISSRTHFSPDCCTTASNALVKRLSRACEICISRQETRRPDSMGGTRKAISWARKRCRQISSVSFTIVFTETGRKAPCELSRPMRSKVLTMAAMRSAVCWMRFALCVTSSAVMERCSRMVSSRSPAEAWMMARGLLTS